MECVFTQSSFTLPIEKKNQLKVQSSAQNKLQELKRDRKAIFSLKT